MNQRSDTADQNGNGESSSCFAGRLTRYGDLSEDEIAFIARMEKDERPVEKGESVVEAGTPVKDLFVLKEGWAVSAMPRRGEVNQSLRIFLPGELIGLSGLGVHTAAHDIRMLTAGLLCPFPKDHMTAIFSRAPRLAALFTAIAGIDQIVLKDRLAVTGAGDARQRMAHFLLDLHERLLLTNPSLGRRFRLPLRQVDIAEILGLTKVYVNRLLRSFTEEGLIEIDRPYIRIMRPDVMKQMVGYKSRYGDLDTSWFPKRSMQSIV